ncbi:hypothetical protein P43SY_012098 [Pythium insidiosum]|uniref:Transposase n=1 Tax=Pythium insidiosum TaxID=114742 RepID=A0AAD5M0Y5_PYTIN|nr:hypothetical protein P43SY_012098 [Pythium insidiosum]
MFLAAVARPRFDPHRKTWFDGKIGLWSLTEKYVAKRASRNRPAGTVCTRNVETVDRHLYKKYIIESVIPGIKAKWPRKDRGRVIFIQQDNAKPHLPPTDPDVIAAGTADGWNIRMLCQPPNSPDLNVLDLGFFASIQSIQYKQRVRGIDSLVNAVVDAFDKTKVETLDNIFLTLESVMTCILQSNGGNDYKLPHMKKAALRKKGELPTRVACDRAAFETACAVLEKAGRRMLF